jgi:hypothetical protein
VPGSAGSADEVCNGVDDDCDGTIDRDRAGAPLAEPCYSGAPGTAGAGPCRAGARVCFDGGWGECQAEVVPTDEVCDGVDNDCDLLVDDAPTGGPLTEACFSESPDLVDVGQCRAGVRTCALGIMSACRGEVLPGLEICDGVDNDCTGAVDDVVGSEDDCGACAPGLARDCYTGADGTLGVGVCRLGQQVCLDDGSGWGPCAGEIVPEAQESCNGLDDDCNGLVDEEIDGLGEDCPVGVGGCQTIGTVACVEGEQICRGFDLLPQDERCNGVDDDCDGLTDEDFALGSACDAGVGACAASGHFSCGDDGGLVCDAVLGDPVAEDCNGADDDCDGLTDEGDGVDEVLLTGACYGGPGETEGVGACRPGSRNCGGDGVWGACRGEVRPGVEVCDGVDNDCDGRVDEDVVGGCGGCIASQTRDCYTGPAGTEGVGACHAGTQACVGGSFGACIGEVVPAAEICNEVDDDCNGRTDDTAHVGDACTNGVGACARAGVRQCVPDVPEPTCNAVPGDAVKELCNDLDDDCDGVVDNGFDLGAPCVSGQGICERRGVLACDADLEASCSAPPGLGQDEFCDGIDNDCDGDIDEGNVAATCPVVSQTTAACVQGACVYTCNDRFFDTDRNPANGCERGCTAAPLGGIIRNLDLRTGQATYDGDLAIAVNGQGTAAVVYSRGLGVFGGTEFVLHTDRDIGLGGDGLTLHGPPAAASIGDAFVAFAGSSVVNDLDARWVGASVRPDGFGGFEALANHWQRQPSILPAAATATVGQTRRAIFATLDNAPDRVDVSGVLVLRIMEVDTGRSVAEPLVGADTDYSLGESRLAAASTPTGVAVAAQYRDDNMRQHHLRLTFVDPDGAVLSSHALAGAWAQPTSEVQVALSGNAMLVGIVDRGGAVVRTWLVSGVGEAGGLFIRQASAVPTVGSAQLSLVAVPNGFIAFVNEGTTLRAVFLSMTGEVEGQVADAVVTLPGQRLFFARAASNGRDIRAAWVHGPDRGPPVTLRESPLDCR